MSSMVWVINRAKGEANAGFERASARRLDALAENISGMAPLWGGNWTILVMRSTRVSGIYIR